MAKNSFIFMLTLIISFFIKLNNQEVNTIPPTEKSGQPENNSSIDEKKLKEINSLMEDFNSKWETKMVDYDSEYDYNIPLKPREQEIYFENVTTVPSTFKGAFLILDETTDKIEFTIKDPNNKIIYKIINHHDVFEIPIKIVGKYTIIFNNKISKSNIAITFTMNSGQNVKLKATDLTKTEQKLEALSTVIKKFNLEFKFGHDIHSNRYKSKFTI